MKLFNKFLLLAVSLAFFTTSCSSDDDATVTTSAPLGAYENGYFILSEGGTASSTSAIDFVSNAGVVTNDVYRIENPAEAEIGSFLQSIFFDATRAFIVSGSTNSITVVNRFTFKHIATISADLNNPRYGVVVNGKAYVTNRNDFGVNDDDYVTVIDLNNNYTTSKIELDVITEQVVAYNGKLVITNGGWQVGNSVTFLNIATSVVNTVDLGAGNFPNSIAVRGNEALLLTDAQKLVKVNLSTEAVSTTIDLPTTITSSSKLQVVNNYAYFKGGSDVYELDLDAATVTVTSLVSFSGTFYGLTVTTDKIYVTDAKDYASLGEAFEYDIDGTLLNSYNTSGFTPNGVYFN